MNLDLLSPKEINNYAVQQFYSLERGFTYNEYSLHEIGSLLPGSVMVHDLKSDNPSKVEYMNDWGCERLNYNKDEIQELGDEYYNTFFIPEQIATFKGGISNLIKKNDFSSGYTFFQQVKTRKQKETEWFFTMCKFLNVKEEVPTKLLVISNPVSGKIDMARKIEKIVQTDLYRTRNFHRFSILTKREKEIIVFLAEGKSTKEISNNLFLSSHTVETHRKNIHKKLETNSLAELIRLAIAFDLISY